MAFWTLHELVLGTKLVTVFDNIPFFRFSGNLYKIILDLKFGSLCAGWLLNYP